MNLKLKHQQPRKKQYAILDTTEALNLSVTGKLIVDGAEDGLVHRSSQSRRRLRNTSRFCQTPCRLWMARWVDAGREERTERMKENIKLPD